MESKLNKNGEFVFIENKIKVQQEILVKQINDDREKIEKRSAEEGLQKEIDLILPFINILFKYGENKSDVISIKLDQKNIYTYLKELAELFIINHEGCINRCKNHGHEDSDLTLLCKNGLICEDLSHENQPCRLLKNKDGIARILDFLNYTYNSQFSAVFGEFYTVVDQEKDADEKRVIVVDLKNIIRSYGDSIKVDSNGEFTFDEKEYYSEKGKKLRENFLKEKSEKYALTINNQKEKFEQFNNNMFKKNNNHKQELDGNTALVLEKILILVGCLCQKK